MNSRDASTAGLEFWTLVGEALEGGRAPEASALSASLAEPGLFREAADPSADGFLAARARVRLELADHRVVDELDFARRNRRTPVAACVLLALAVDARGPDAFDDHADPARIAVRKAAASARRELHRLEGLLRFDAVGGRAWLARCVPDHDLVDLLAALVVARFGSDRAGPVPFAVIDEGRSRAAGRDGRGVAFIASRATPEAVRARLGAASAGTADAAPGADGGTAEEAGDGDFPALWRTYFAAVAIPERRNPDLQRRFVPVRYRDRLPEFGASGHDGDDRSRA